LKICNQSLSVWFGSILLASILPVSANQELLESFKANIEPLLDNYCYDCHGFGVSEGNVTMDELNKDTIEDHSLWMRVLKNTRAHIMPPREEAQPSLEERQMLAAWIKAEPFGFDPKNPDPGRMTVQRLNRVEYGKTVEDLMGIEFDPDEVFPPDDSGEGFDNIGEVLTVSPMLLEKYLDAAQSIVAEAVPLESKVVPERFLEKEELVRIFSEPGEGDDDKDNLYLSFYSPSTRLARHEITEAGDYQIVLKILPKAFSSFQGFDYNRCRFRFLVDGELLLEKEYEHFYGSPHEFTYEFTWQPGWRELSFEVEPLTDVERIKDLKMEVISLAIQGPLGDEHMTAPEDYETFFPGTVPENQAQRKRYTQKLLTDFVTKAYRRPPERQTVDKLVALATDVASQEGNNYETGIANAMVAVLASPGFIFREEGTERVRGNKHPLIDEYALATRMSYFLWSTMPDEELFELAAKGKLRKNLDQQIDRMLADKRFNSFIKNFGGQWLHSRDITAVNISDYDVWLREQDNPELIVARKEYQIVREIAEALRTPEQQETYVRTRKILYSSADVKRPDWSGALRNAMRDETEQFFEYVIHEDRPLTELLDSDYTFVNQLLANHYGIEGVKGPKTRKVQLEPGSPRGGVLTQGTILAFTSNPTRTSPVKRGVFLLENILGTPPAPPPPNIPALEDVTADGNHGPLSLRESLAIHREEPLCASCHNRMDPLGLALENFNAMGMWRDSELGLPIDSEGVLITGEEFSSIQELKRILATDRKRDFYYCISEKLLTYALGRGLDYYDTETIDQLVNQLEISDGKPSALLKGIIQSVPFQKTRNPNFKTE
jgi:hypothetical protein